jgi:RHS repeat-associated protein
MPYGSDRVNVQNQGFNPSYKFTDQEKDNESNLMYYDSRYYNQSIGRFIQSDPLSLYLYDNEQVKENTQRDQNDILSNLQYLNSYAYTLNNPIVYVDPDGNISFRPLFRSTFNVIKSYVQWIGEAYKQQQSKQNLKDLNSYAGLSKEERAQYGSFKNFKESEVNKEMVNNTMMGAVGGGMVKKSTTELVTLYHGSANNFSEILEKGFQKVGKLFLTDNAPLANAYQYKFGLTDDFGVKTIKIAKDMWTNLIKEGHVIKTLIEDI